MSLSQFMKIRIGQIIPLNRCLNFSTLSVKSTIGIEFSLLIGYAVLNESLILPTEIIEQHNIN